MNVKELKKEYIKYKGEIKERLKDFSEIKPEEYFYELIFCLLTPQSNAEKCWNAVEELKKCSLKKHQISKCLRSRTRFYKNKTKYIVEAVKKKEKIEKIIYGEKNPISLRKDLVKEFKGLGMKEASHFLRNIGKSNNQLAILDRHVMRKLKELKIIKNILSLTEKNYIETENLMKKFSKKVKIPLDNLDLLFWKLESGRIFK